MPPYPYNMDPAYGSVPLLTEAEKMRAEMGGGPSPVQIKEERNKESSSPNDHPKNTSQVRFLIFGTSEFFFLNFL